MKRIWVNKADSFNIAKKFDQDYYLNMSTAERLEVVQSLRESYLKMKRRLKNEGRERLRRVVKIVQ